MNFCTTKRSHLGRSLVVSAIADHLMDEVYSHIFQKMLKDSMENLKLMIFCSSQGFFISIFFVLAGPMGVSVNMDVYSFV